MKTLFTILGWLLLGALVAAGYIGLLFLFRGNKTELSTQDVLSALNMVTLVLCVALSCFALGLLWKILKALFPPKKDEDEALRRRLIALCISALLFHSFFSSLAGAVVSATVSLFSGLATDLESSSLRRLVAERDYPSWSDALDALWALLQLLFMSLTRFLSSILRAVTTADAVLAYVVWMIAYYALARPAGDDGSQTGAFRNWLAQMNPSKKHHLIQAGVFMLGCYLSVAAMVAIPALQKQVTDTTATKERLQSALEAATIQQVEFDRDYPQDHMSAHDPFVKLKQCFSELPSIVTSATSDAGLSESAQSEWQKKVQSVKEALSDAQARRLSVSVKWQNYRREMNALNQSLVRKAISALDVDTLSPQAGPERAAYFQDIITWHRAGIADLQGNLRNNMSFMEYLDSRLEQAAESVATTLRAEPGLLQTSRDTGSPAPVYPSALSYEIQSLRGAFDNLKSTRVFEKPVTYVDYFPKPPEPGDFAGPFGFIARWLLRTRSFSLALITGMIGFGLFGASIASIVRVNPAELKGDDPRNYASRTIIQGLSAAVVIYLAVQGGLVVLAAGDKEPNGYILCFVCLVGAVFSERVWLWAGDRLNDMLRPGAKQNDSKKQPPLTNSKPEEEQRVSGL